MVSMKERSRCSVPTLTVLRSAVLSPVSLESSRKKEVTFTSRAPLRIAPDDVEPSDDGVHGGGTQRAGNAVALGCELCLHIFAQEERLPVMLLPVDDAVVDLLAAQQLEPLRDGKEARHAEQVPSQERVGHLEVPVLVDVADGEQSVLFAAPFGNQLGVNIVYGRGVLSRPVCRRGQEQADKRCPENFFQSCLFCLYRSADG